MIFHEAGGLSEGIGLPDELLGRGMKPFTDAQTKHLAKMRAHIEAYVKAVREAAPDMKFIVGNSSAGFNFMWLRDRLPRNLWDAMGMEMAVQRFHPEDQPIDGNMQTYWLAKQMCKQYGYDDLPVTACFEVDYRPTAPGALSPDRQADWYARDALLSLAYGLPDIYVGLLDDTNSSYYTSRWGSTGVMERAPQMMPKPAYAALATLTDVLDRAKYLRTVPTGSTATQCLEFKTDADYVYPIWTSRGRQPLRLRFQTAPDELTVVHRDGRRARQRADAPLTAGPSPQYVVSPTPIAGITLGEPVSAAPSMRDVQQVCDLSAETWRLDTKPADVLTDWCAYKPLVPAKATIKTVDGALQLTLERRPDVPDLVGQYVALKPKDGAISIAGRPDTVGVWVKGNGSWGRVMFELTDARGRRWVSNGWCEDKNSWDMSDWEARMSINFDGWRMIVDPLPLHYPSGYYGPYFRDWRCVGDNSLDNEIAYPVKLSGLYVIMRQRLVHVTEMVDATSLSVDLRSVVAGETGRALVLQDATPEASEGQK